MHEIELKLPAQRNMMLVIRLTTAGVIARAGLGVDRMDDVKMAVVEACSCLMGENASGMLNLNFAKADGQLMIRVCADDGCSAPPANRDELLVEKCILESLVDDVQLHVRDAAVCGVDLRIALEA